MNAKHTAPTLELADSLGFTGWFSDPTDPELGPELHFSSVIASPGVVRDIDCTALCEFPTRYTFFGKRTLLRSIRRSDLFSKEPCDDGAEPLRVPRHADYEATAMEVAEGLSERLLSETRERVNGRGQVGILLSGGMDSRVIAAILRMVQQETGNFAVTCFCWGHPDTRDPVYARLIAQKYGWRFEHFHVSGESLLANVDHAARNGCFHSAQHLHAMPQVAERARQLGIEVMLAASYGDGIGRAEYGGVHVGKLHPIERRLRNWYDLLEPDLFGRFQRETLTEIARCRRRYGVQSKLATNELDQQQHYMRNMLGSAMSVIDADIPLAQSFTSREVVEYMWGFAPKSRDDEVYLYALRGLDPELLEIPWARTGKPYLQHDAKPDALPRSFHRYADWTREISVDLEDRIFGGEIERLNAFNMKAVRRVFDGLMKNEFVRSGRFLEVTLWLASLATFLAEVQPPPVRKGPPARRLTLRGQSEFYSTLLNQYRHFGRKKVH